jgi:hypothetical protein
MSDVELRIEHARAGTDESLSCSREFWDLMLTIGNAFGWKPVGTSYLPTSFKIAPGQHIRRHDYRPGDWHDAKRLTGEDTFAWAAALRIALDSPHLSNMLSAQQDGSATPDISTISIDDSSVRESIDEFIGVLRKGALLFATHEPHDANESSDSNDSINATETNRTESA